MKASSTIETRPQAKSPLRQSAVRSGAMAMSAAVSRPPTRKWPDPMNSCFGFRADEAYVACRAYGANRACSVALTWPRVQGLSGLQAASFTLRSKPQKP